MMLHTISRRGALLGLTSVIGLGRSSLALAAAATEQRFVVIMLRGALDGLSAVTPYGDPALAGLRGELLASPPGQPNGLLDLGGFYGLHPSLSGMHGLYREGELAIVHAVAGPYRSRSHFEAQDLMESGADHRLTSGWLNRVAALLPAQQAKKPGSETALSVGTTVALLLRGPAPVGTWLPQGFTQPEAEIYRKLAALHRSDPVTGPAIAEGLKDRGFSEQVLSGSAQVPNKYAFPALASAAGKLLAAPDGPRIAALEIGGWDTHVAQVTRMPGVLGPLDQGIVALKAALGPAWKRTVVLVMTEFGRTVEINGTKGTDHGTGTVGFIAGGNVAGGRVVADWPGLGQGKLLDHRDLMPTADLRSVAKGLLGPHLGLDAGKLATVFPDSAPAGPMRGLLRA